MSEEITTQEAVPGEWFDEVRRRAEEIRSQAGDGGNSTFYELRNPERAARALWMLSRGETKQSIVRACGIQLQALTRMAWRHKDTLETKKKEASREFAMTAEMAKDALQQRLSNLMEDNDMLNGVSPDKLALTVAIMTDKAMALSGMAGVVIEHRRGASIDDARNMIKQAKEKVAAKALVLDAVVVTKESEE